MLDGVAFAIDGTLKTPANTNADNYIDIFTLSVTY